MTTLNFDSGYAMFQSDSALFGRPKATPAIFRHLGQFAASSRAEAAADLTGRIALALVPFSAIAWVFIAR